tara:strand:+ start:67 stop:258 length:192 start_codon:yes stop_codon:yes gene_type:complete
MKKKKKNFNKKAPHSSKKIEDSTEDKDNNIDTICRFKLLFNEETGKYEKVAVYQLDELSEDEA